MPKKKLKWNDVEDIAFRLIDEHPDTNPMHLRLNELKNHVTALRDFGDDAKKAKDEVLEAIQTTWFEERSEMEDELGPLSTVRSDEEDNLDEDDYRDDKMIDEEKVLDEESVVTDEDEDEDEFGEGFQEEEAD